MTFRLGLLTLAPDGTGSKYNKKQKIKIYPGIDVSGCFDVIVKPCQYQCQGIFLEGACWALFTDLGLSCSFRTFFAAEKSIGRYLRKHRNE